MCRWPGAADVGDGLPGRARPRPAVRKRADQATPRAGWLRFPGVQPGVGADCTRERPAAAAACSGAAAFALAPHDALRYWTQIAYQPARIGGISYASNQSILGVLARIGLGNPARAWLWAALCLLVAALAVIGMRGALRTGHVTHALLLNAAAGLLISPISWSHHWVWAAPALLTCLATTNPNQRRLLACALLALLTFAIAPHWLLPSGGGRELHWSWWQQAMGDSYALIGLVVLTWAAIKNLLTRPRSQSLDTRGTLAELHDQELRPVPSETRDDLSVPTTA